MCWAGAGLDWRRFPGRFPAFVMCDSFCDLCLTSGYSFPWTPASIWIEDWAGTGEEHSSNLFTEAVTWDSWGRCLFPRNLVTLQRPATGVKFPSLLLHVMEWHPSVTIWSVAKIWDGDEDDEQNNYKSVYPSSSSPLLDDYFIFNLELWIISSKRKSLLKNSSRPVTCQAS